MPIRFRCPHCTRLLGIARRKAGAQINCPQCTQTVTVPIEDATVNVDDLDNLINPAASPNGVAEPEEAAAVQPPPPAPAIPVTRSRSESPRSAGPAVAAKPAPRPKRVRKPGEEAPLFEQDDVDALLGVSKPGETFDLDEPASQAKPVSGMDANSLDDGNGKVVLSSQKATLLVVAVVVLLGVAFAAGFLIASSL
jgi:phage FluMu protein Com